MSGDFVEITDFESGTKDDEAMANIAARRKPPIIHSRKFIERFAEAFGVQVNECYRIVIDAKVDDALRVYVSKFGTEDLLKVELPDATGVTVTVVGGDAE